MATGTRSNSNLGQDENKQMLLKLQAEMASRFQQSEERMQNIEEKIKENSASHEKKMEEIFSQWTSRIEQMLSQQHKAKSPHSMDPQGSGILKTPPNFHDPSQSVNKQFQNQDWESRMNSNSNINLPRTDFPIFDGSYLLGNSMQFLF